MRYWLCCGSTEYPHGGKHCYEARSGREDRVRYGTREEHSTWAKENSMPYIKEDRRKALMINWEPKDSGELNYMLTQEITNYLKHKGLCYQTLNDIMGALEGAKLEFYRRVAAPYETLKMSQNGDCYDTKQKAP